MADGSCAISAAAAGVREQDPIVAAVPSNQAGHPIHVSTTALSGFSSEAIDKWVNCHFVRNSQVLSSGLTCSRAVTAADCNQKAVFTI